MDEGGVQFYFNDKVVLHNSGAVSGGREGHEGDSGEEGRVWGRREKGRV